MQDRAKESGTRKTRTQVSCIKNLMQGHASFWYQILECVTPLLIIKECYNSMAMSTLNLVDIQANEDDVRWWFWPDAMAFTKCVRLSKWSHRSVGELPVER